MAEYIDREVLKEYLYGGKFQEGCSCFLRYRPGIETQCGYIRVEMGTAQEAAGRSA